KGTCWGSECAGTACTGSADCAAGQQCVHGTCLGALPNGDPCSNGQDCASTTCSAKGYCAVACANDDACPKGLVCSSADPDNPGECIGKQPMGGPCDSADDCLGGRCLAGAGEAPICTHECKPALADCPASWTCGRVDSADVCQPMPPEVNASGGCSVSKQSPPAGPAY